MYTAPFLYSYILRYYSSLFYGKILYYITNEVDGMNSIINMDNVLTGTYFITGITGFIGSLLTRSLLQSRSYKNGEIKIIGLIRNLQKANAIYEGYDTSNLQFITSDLLELTPEKLNRDYHIQKIDYIFHCAANTRSNDMITYPVETAGGILIGTNNILEVAKDYAVQSMVYLSSMEVYGSVSDRSERISEDYLGNIDTFSTRSCYPLGKRMAENLCFCYYKQYQVPVKIARLAQTFGPGILPNETRIFFQFAKCVLTGNDIILHTKGDSVGNYVDSVDAVNALMLLLTQGINGQAYNIVNEDSTMTILDMAHLVASKIAKNKIKICFDIPAQNQFGYAAKTELRLSAKKIRSLGWNPNFGMEDMYIRMLADMQ